MNEMPSFKESDFPVMVDFIETEIAKKFGYNIGVFNTIDDFNNNKKSFVTLKLNYPWH